MSQSRVFRGTARRIIQTSAATFFYYHNTAVVTVAIDGTVTLNSGGYMTATTKLAMNQASNQHAYGFQVYQTNGEWHVRFDNGLVHDFFDGFTFTVQEARALITGHAIAGFGCVAKRAS